MPRFSNGPFLATTLSLLSSRAKPSGSAVRHSCAPLLPVHKLHQSPPNPHENTNLPIVIPGFQEGSAEPRIPPRHAGTGRLRSPGFPVEIGGVGELHAPFLTRKAHTQPVRRSVAGNPARDDKKERVVARKGRLLNRGIFQIEFGQLLRSAVPAGLIHSGTPSGRKRYPTQGSV
jgi:hypothetical protein